jgi:hypothetical protein
MDQPKTPENQASKPYLVKTLSREIQQLFEHARSVTRQNDHTSLGQHNHYHEASNTRPKLHSGPKPYLVKTVSGEVQQLSERARSVVRQNDDIALGSSSRRLDILVHVVERGDGPRGSDWNSGLELVEGLERQADVGHAKRGRNPAKGLGV